MRFLADENVEQAVVDVLRAAGHDVSCVGDVLPGAADLGVLALAASQNRILVTNDKDFGRLAYREARAAVGILLLRLGCEDGPENARRLATFLPSIAVYLPDRFAVLTDRGARLRPLRDQGSDTTA